MRKFGGGGAELVDPVTEETPFVYPVLEVVTVTVAKVP